MLESVNNAPYFRPKNWFSLMNRDNNNIQISKKYFFRYFALFRKIKYFNYFKYFLNILPIFRNYSEKKDEKPFFEQLFAVFSSYPNFW